MYRDAADQLCSVRLAICLIAVWLVTAAAVAANAELAARQYSDIRGTLAFTLFENDQSDIYLLRLSSGEISSIVTSPKIDEYPSFSPDGKRILFYSEMDGDREVYLIQKDGKGLTRLTRSAGFDEDPSWSPDGKQIVFSSARGGRGQNLYLMNADGSGVQPLTETKSRNTVPRWSPQGDKIIFSSDGFWPGWDLVLLRLDTGATEKVTSGFITFCRGSFSPDGKQVVFSRGMGAEIDLWRMHLESREEKQLTKSPGKEYDAIWVGGGEKIFFTGERQKGSGKFEVYVIDSRSEVISPILLSDRPIRYLSWTAEE